jgi:methyltransferase (TIGR00027 family)
VADKISAEQLTGVMETLLTVLYSRVVETRREDGIINDPIAVEWVSRIDYDFSRFDDGIINHFGVAVRTEILDEYVQSYIEECPNATIINIAAGLDTRFYRMDNGKIHWYEVDLLESITVRRQLMEETERHQCIIASALDTDWMDTLPKTGNKLFIVEGLLMYFTEKQVKSFLGSLAERFSGAQLLLEIMGITQSQTTHLNDAISKTDAVFQWGIRDVADMADWHPKLRLLDYTSYYDRHEDRWFSLPIGWKDKNLTQYRDSVSRIVHLKVGE